MRPIRLTVALGLKTGDSVRKTAKKNQATDPTHHIFGPNFRIVTVGLVERDNHISQCTPPFQHVPVHQWLGFRVDEGHIRWPEIRCVFRMAPEHLSLAADIFEQRCYHFLQRQNGQRCVLGFF